MRLRMRNILGRIRSFRVSIVVVLVLVVLGVCLGWLGKSGGEIGAWRSAAVKECLMVCV